MLFSLLSFSVETYFFVIGLRIVWNRQIIILLESQKIVFIVQIYASKKIFGSRERNGPSWEVKMASSWPQDENAERDSVHLDRSKSL